MGKVFRNKKVEKLFIAILVIITVISGLNLVLRVCVGRLDESDVSEYCIYTPTGVPREYRVSVFEPDMV